MTISLYPHQDEQINEVRQAMRSHKRVLMQSPTGSGKSVMASAMISAARDKGSRSVFIVPRRELLKQMADTFATFHIPHSFVAPKYPFNPKAKTHIASLQSLKRRLPEMSKPDVVFVDETHFGTNMLNDMVEHYTALGCYIVGLSATPKKMSGQGLECWYDVMVQGKSVRWLMDNGFLSEYRAFAPSKVDLEGIGSSNGDYARGAIDERMSDSVIIGNAVSHYKRHACGKLNIAYCAGIKSSMKTAEKFISEGIPAAHVDGKTPPDVLRKIISDFAARRILVLCNCDLLTFGFDLALNAGVKDVTVECMSDLRPTKSLPLQLQKWGRVLRRKDEPALIFDHANNFDTHGLPCQEREWSLASEDKDQREQGERDVEVRQCPICYRCHEPTPTCPSCGYEYPIVSREVQELEGELEEVDPKVVRAKRASEEYRCETLEDWQALGKERGHKPGWAFHRFTNMRPRD